MSSFLRYVAKRATYDVGRAVVRDSFRSIAAADKTASATQMRALSAHFLQAARAMAPEEVIGFVDVGHGDRRSVTAGNLISVLEIVKDGALSFYVVENGKEQLLPPNTIKALCLAAKARARLDVLAPVTLTHTAAPPTSLTHDASDPGPMSLAQAFAPPPPEPLIDVKLLKRSMIFGVIGTIILAILFTWMMSQP